MAEIPRPPKSKSKEESKRKKFEEAKANKAKAKALAKRRRTQADKKKVEYQVAREAAERAEKVADAHDKPTVLTGEDLEATSPKVREQVLESTEPVWIPDFDPMLSTEENQRKQFENPGPQARFLNADEDEVLFAGGRGSGKSDALIVDPLRYCSNKNFRGLVLRNTMDELRELITRAQDLYPQAYPGTKWKQQEKIFTFPSGAKIEFGYCNSLEDVDRYKGQQYTWIGIDEITKFPSIEWYNKLQGSLRTADDKLKTYMRATTNPDGPGRTWVKEHWVDKAAPEEAFAEIYSTAMGEIAVTRKYFVSNLDDNKVLLVRDPTYVAKLHSIKNKTMRKQWLYGDWGAAEGLAFDEFDAALHTCKPFEIPHNWFKFRACDWGYSSMAACIWIAVDYDNTMYVYREFTANGTGTPVEQRLKAPQFAYKVLDLEMGENIKYGVLDSSTWQQRGQVGESPAETMVNAGCRWQPSDRNKGARSHGKQLIHEALSINEETGKPYLVIFDTCRELIKQLTSLMTDPNNTEDIDQKNKTKLPDHAYDALRYALLSRPITRTGRRKTYNNTAAGAFMNNRKLEAYTPVSTIFGY